MRRPPDNVHGRSARANRPVNDAKMPRLREGHVCSCYFSPKWGLNDSLTGCLPSAGFREQIFHLSIANEIRDRKVFPRPDPYGARFTSDCGAVLVSHRDDHHSSQTTGSAAAESSARAVRALARWTPSRAILCEVKSPNGVEAAGGLEGTSG
jgi:hypothetical protein